MSVGIHEFGGYVPIQRLKRKAIADANAWFNPALRGLGKGERSICNWDEDSVTMAVEAARDALGGTGSGSIDAVYFASTTLPFQDRQNAGIIAEALHLGSELLTMDVAGSQRAGTTALTAALKAAASGDRIIVAASEKRRTKAASPIELTAGDAAGALVIAEGDGAAKLLGQATHAVDFVDHYRGQDEAFDYVWEERWIRDEGYNKIVPAAVNAALANAGIKAGDINHFIFPVAAGRVAGGLAKKLGIPDTAVRDNMQGTVGEAGSAHAIVMLVQALEKAKRGDIILVTSFGQGCDALIFGVTDAVNDAKPAIGISGAISRRREEENYNRFLGINNLVNMEQGLRAEVGKQTGMTTLFRNKEMILSLVGGKCSECGTLQYPKSNVCANPNCGAVGTQEDQPFADMPAKLNSFTADSLTFSPDPPAYYGMVQFEDGGRGMLDLTDVDPNSELKVGQPLRMVFRIKEFDTKRGFRRYFWKATPNTEQEGA